MSGPSSLQTAPDVRLLLSVPADARAEPSAALPPIPLPPGLGEVVARAGWVTPGGIGVRAACVRAPSDRWAPGMEELVLARATDIARASSGATLATWVAGARTREGLVWSQRLQGVGDRGGAPVVATGRHLLGFRGSDHEAVLCSVVCAEPSAHACAAVADAARLEGGLVAEPPPTWWLRGLVLAAESPRTATLLVLIAFAVVAAVVLRRRPRVPR